MVRAVAAIILVALVTRLPSPAGVIARSRYLWPGMARRLARGRWNPTWSILAANPRIPSDVAKSLLDHGDSVRLALAGNPAIPADVAHALLDGGPQVRTALAQNPALPVDLQMLLSADDDAAGTLAANPVLTTRLQLRLAREGSEHVGAQLAGNPCLAPGVQEVLATRPQTAAGSPTLASLTGRHDLTPRTLRLLLAGRHRAATVQRMRQCHDLGSVRRWRVRDLDTGTRGAAIAMAATDRLLPSRAAEHPDPLIRIAVTANPVLPVEHLRRLIDDIHPEVRRAARERILADLRLGI